VVGRVVVVGREGRGLCTIGPAIWISQRFSTTRSAIYRSSFVKISQVVEIVGYHLVVSAAKALENRTASEVHYELAHPKASGSEDWKYGR